MKQTVAPDHFGFCIRQKREGIALLGGVFTSDLYWVHADGHDPCPAGLKLIEECLETPQLGVAGRSPVPAVEDYDQPSSLPMSLPTARHR